MQRMLLWVKYHKQDKSSHSRKWACKNIEQQQQLSETKEWKQKENMKCCKGELKHRIKMRCSWWGHEALISIQHPRTEIWGQGPQVWSVNTVEAIYMKYTRKSPQLALWGAEGETQRVLLCSPDSKLVTLPAWPPKCYDHKYVPTPPLCYFISPFIFISKLVIRLKNIKNLKGPLDSDAKHLKNIFF